MHNIITLILIILMGTFKILHCYKRVFPLLKTLDKIIILITSGMKILFNKLIDICSSYVYKSNKQWNIQYILHNTTTGSVHVGHNFWFYKKASGRLDNNGYHVLATSLYSSCENCDHMEVHKDIPHTYNFQGK